MVVVVVVVVAGIFGAVVVLASNVALAGTAVQSCWLASVVLLLLLQTISPPLTSLCLPACRGGLPENHFLNHYVHLFHDHAL